MKPGQHSSLCRPSGLDPTSGFRPTPVLPDLDHFRIQTYFGHSGLDPESIACTNYLSGYNSLKLFKSGNILGSRSKDLKAKGDHPFDFKGLYAVEKYQDHKKSLNINGPAIIIAGSGMCTGGRIVDHLRLGLEDPANDIFFVGEQAKGAPGRILLSHCGFSPNPYQMNSMIMDQTQNDLC